MSLVTLVWRRAVRHWQMLLTLGLGVVIATALLWQTKLHRVLRVGEE